MSLLPYAVFTALTMAAFAAFPVITCHFAVAGHTRISRRKRACGVFNTVYGAA